MASFHRVLATQSVFKQVGKTDQFFKARNAKPSACIITKPNTKAIIR